MTPRPLIVLGSIVGDGVHAAEMVEIVERINREEPRWLLRGFILDDGAGQRTLGYPILGGSGAIADHPDAWFAAMNGRPPAALVPRERLVSLVDPSCFVSRTAALGAGVVIFPHAYVGADARLDDHVFVLAGCVINHDVHLAERVVLTASVSIAGNVRVGEGSYLGQGCSIREKITIGRNCLVGAGAVVVRDVPDDSVVVGNPARFLRQRHREGNVDGTTPR